MRTDSHTATVHFGIGPKSHNHAGGHTYFLAADSFVCNLVFINIRVFLTVMLQEEKNLRQGP
jgi:hypothetical protein